MYAVGDPHPLQQPCRGLIGLISEGDIEATTTTEVIQEFAHVRSRRRTRGDATKLAKDYAGLLQPLARVEEVDLLDGLGIFEAVPQIDAFDAILAAVTRRNGFEALVSADRGFGSVAGLRWEEPEGAWQRLRSNKP